MSEQDKTLPVVSLIVPLKNDDKFIEQCLESLIAQGYPAEKLEIIVVDGKSKDGSLKMVEEFNRLHGRIRLLENPRVITAAGANIGLKQARGAVLGVISSHSTLDREYVATMVKLLNERPDVMCAGGSMKTIGSGYLGQAIAIVLSSSFGVGGSKFRTSNRAQLVDTLAFGLYPRSVFETIGLFDERLVRNEDNQFHWRLRKTGAKLMLVPDAHSYYHAPGTIRKFTRQAYNNGLWNIRLLRLVGAGLSGRHLVPFFFVATLIIAIGLSLYGQTELLAALALAYFAGSAIASLAAGVKRGWRFIAVLPILFLLMHLSYGIGSLVGLIEAFAGLGLAGQSDEARPVAIEKLSEQKEEVS